jgi:hypothetical protein
MTAMLSSVSRSLSSISNLRLKPCVNISKKTALVIIWQKHAW